MLMKCWWQFFDTYYWQTEYSIRSASMNKQEWVEDISAEGSLSCSDQNTWSFKAWVKWARQVTTITILVFKKADLALFRDLFGIKDKGTQKNWQIFKCTLFKAQEWSFLTFRKPSKYGRNERRWIQDQTTKRKGDIAWAYKDTDMKSQRTAGAKTSYR